MGTSIGKILTDLLGKQGDVQSFSITILFVGSLFFTFLYLLSSLRFNKQPVPVKKKRRRSLGSYVNHVPSVSTSQRRTQAPKAVGNSQSCNQPVIVSCREVPRYQPSVLCVTCDRVPAKKGCRYSQCGGCCRANKSSVCSTHGTGVSAARGIVEGALNDNPLELDLSYMNLKQCPPRIGYVGTQLIHLNLINNRLTELPREIGLLRGLEELFVQYNCLKELPDTIGQLHKLQELDCKNNHLNRLPAGLGCLTDLSIFNANNNTLQSLPSEIGNLSRLEELWLHSNQLTTLPDSICSLLNLKTLYLGENRLTELPTGFGSLVRLTELDLSSCQLVHLPNSLSRCTSLTKVWLSDNKLQSLPDQMGRLHQLKELHVRNNCIKYFPASLSYLQLCTFSANQNPLLLEFDQSERARLTVSQEAEIPPLLELAARQVARSNVTWSHGDLPTELADLLRSCKQCSSCEGPFFRFFQSEVVFANIGIFHRVPLYQQICSPFRNLYCHPVDFPQ